MYTNSVFEESWYLDAVAPGQWKELKVERDGVLIARWPIVISGKKMKIPKFVQTLGIWMNPDYVKTLEDEEKVYLQLIEQLPNGINIQWSLAPNNRFYLPFLWNGFNVSVGASYALEDLSDIDAILQNMSSSMRYEIRRSQKMLIVEESNDIDKLAEMLYNTYARQGRGYIVNSEILHRLYAAAKEHNACSMLAARDVEGRVHSMTMFVYDENRCYFLVSASDPILNAKSTANTLLVWEGIKIAAKHSKVFDFEGSSIRGIGTFLRRFGGKFTPHYTITRNDLLGDLLLVVKPRIKSILGHKK